VKLNLYIENYLNLSNRQRYFWMKNRIIKKNILAYNKYILNVTDNIINNYSPDLGGVNNNINMLIPKQIMENKQKTNNKSSISGNSLYYKDLIRIINMPENNINEDILHEKWFSTEQDLEIRNNFQRFYLFKEAINELSFPLASYVNLICLWISKSYDLDSISWHPFNCAIRLFNWIKSQTISDDMYNKYNYNKEVVIKSMLQQSYIISNNIEYELSGNHVIIELYVIWLIGNVFKEFKYSDKWINYAEKKLEKEVMWQFNVENFHCEHSLHYHIQTSLFCMLWIYGMMKLKRNIPNNVFNIIEKACINIKYFTFNNNYIPSLSNSCFSFLTSSMEDDVLLINNLYSDIYKKSYNTIKDKYIIDMGQYVLAKISSTYLIIDVGNIGYLHNPGHGHSDILSFIYYDKNIPIFIDSGTKSYQNDIESNVYKTSMFHNTISIDRHSQAEIWSNFRWSHLPKIVNYTIFKDEDKFQIKANYTGFKKIGKFKHYRDFILKKGELVVKDLVFGKGIHDIYLNFILYPEIYINIINNKLQIHFKNHIWLVNVIPSINCSINVHDIKIYLVNGKISNTKRIEFVFLKNKLPLSIETQILRA
jgi:Heparinase II/III-like protein/Heparinase II/III N-terminus